MKKLFKNLTKRMGTTYLRFPDGSVVKEQDLKKAVQIWEIVKRNKMKIGDRYE